MVIALAVVLGLVTQNFIEKVNNSSVRAEGMLVSDSLARTISQLESEFLLVGIQDVAAGEKLLVEQKEAVEKFHASLNDLHRMGLTTLELEAMTKIEEATKLYEAQFADIVDNFA